MKYTLKNAINDKFYVIYFFNHSKKKKSLTTFTPPPSAKEKTPQCQLSIVVLSLKVNVLNKKDSKTCPCSKSEMIMTATPFQDKQHSQISLVCQALSISDVKKRHSAETGDLAGALQRVHSVASKSPSFFPFMKVCFDLSISPETTIKKAIYQINTEYCRSHLQAACTFPRRGYHANSGSMFIVQKYQFQQSPAA